MFGHFAADLGAAMNRVHMNEPGGQFRVRWNVAAERACNDRPQQDTHDNRSQIGDGRPHLAVHPEIRYSS